MGSKEWKTYKLGHLADVLTGPFGSQLHQRDYVEYGTPIITVEHLGENQVIHKNLPRVTEQDKQRLQKYMLIEGDIVFSRVGSVDRRAIIKKAEEGWLFSGRCLRVRPKIKELNPTYLSYYFGLDTFKEYIRAIAVGSTMPSLNTKILNEINIPLPPLATQNQIAYILSTLDEKIELNRQMNATLEAIAQAIFKEWFVNFNFPGATGELVESELGMIPKGWSVGCFQDILNLEIGGDWGKDNPFEGSIKVISLRGTDIEQLKSSGYAQEAPIRLVKETSLEKRRITENDILIAGSGLGPIGKSIYCGKFIHILYQYPIIFSNFCKKLRAKLV